MIMWFFEIKPVFPKTKFHPKPLPNYGFIGSFKKMVVEKLYFYYFFLK